jgi:hypothetical protein
VVAVLCYAQPLVRSWKRYRTRFFHPGVVIADDRLTVGAGPGLPWGGARTLEYWSEEGGDRCRLLDQVVAYLTERRWAKVIDPGWSDRDLVVYCHPWTEVAVCTVQEEHGGGRRLIRARFRVRLRNAAWLLVAFALAAAGAAALWSPMAAAAAVAATLALGMGLWRRGLRRAAGALAVFDHAARRLGLTRCGPADT